jgi:hypothetical protein
MGRWKNILADTKGAEIAEAALVLPLMFTLLLGIFSFGRAYNIYATVTHAAREGARVAVVPSCASCAASACNWGTTAFPCDSAVANAVNDALRASRLTPSEVSIYTPAPPPAFCPGLSPPGACTVSGNITVCRGVRLTAAGSSVEECGALVSFQYPYQFNLPFTSLNLQLINLPASAEMRMEY